MDTKTKIIVQEIKSWRNNKLLPEQYCDFLLALYTEGSENSLNDKKKRKILSYAAKLCLVVITITFLVYYFSDFSRQMQISLSIILYALCGGVFLLGLRYSNFSLQCISLLIVILSLAWRTKGYFEQNVTLILHEGSWIISAILMLVLAWFLRNHYPILYVSLCVNGIVLFYTPSFQALFMSESNLSVIQLILIVKLMCTIGFIISWKPYRVLLTQQKT